MTDRRVVLSFDVKESADEYALSFTRQGAEVLSGMGQSKCRRRLLQSLSLLLRFNKPRRWLSRCGLMIGRGGGSCNSFPRLEHGCRQSNCQ